jgi:hypothetical protein
MSRDEGRTLVVGLRREFLITGSATEAAHLRNHVLRSLHQLCIPITMAEHPSFTLAGLRKPP